MLSPQKYREAVRRPYPPLQSSLFLCGFADQNNFRPFFPEGYALTEVVVLDDMWYCSDAQLDSIGRKALEAWKNYSIFLQHKERFLKLEYSLLKESKGKIFSSFACSFEAYMPAVLMISYIDPIMNSFLRSLFSETYSPQETEEVMNTLNTPMEDNIYKKEEYELVIATNLASHIKKYKGLYSRYGEERFYTVEEAR